MSRIVHSTHKYLIQTGHALCYLKYKFDFKAMSRNCIQKYQDKFKRIK